MSQRKIGSSDLLEYNSHYKLVVCRPCGYAIQKGALESHLLRHKIYRSNRQRLISSIARLDLLEPKDVPLPPPDSPPIKSLPTFSGFRCVNTGCEHLTISAKRMKRHWSSSHGLDGSAPISSEHARPVTLQTFFRGTKVRYFEVTVPAVPLSYSGRESETERDVDSSDSEATDRCSMTCAGQYEQQELHTDVQMDPALPELIHATGSVLGNAGRVTATSFDLDTLVYFHQFTTKTSITLPDLQNPEKRAFHWQTYVTQQALQDHCLMSGVLAISAFHMAASSGDEATRANHCRHATRFYADVVAGITSAVNASTMSRIPTTNRDIARLRKEVASLCKCAQWMLTGFSTEPDTSTSFQLLPFLSLLQNFARARDEDYRWIMAHECKDHADNNVLRQSVSAVNSGSDGVVPEEILARLHQLPSRLTERLRKPKSMQDVFTILDTNNVLVECCRIDPSDDNNFWGWQIMVGWLSSLSDYFNHMLSRCHPAALVLIAHWAAILVYRVERMGCWFLRGAARKVVSFISMQISLTSPEVLELVDDLVAYVEE